MSGETMNAETMSGENTDINISITTLYINTILCIFGCVLGIVRLSLGLLSSSFIMIGFELSICYIYVEKLMIYVSDDINVLCVNKNIQTITDFVNIMLSKTVYNSHLFNNQTLSERNDEYDNQNSHIGDDDDEEKDDDEEVTEINNRLEPLDTTDDLQTDVVDDDDDYADLPDLIPYNYIVDDDYVHDYDDDYADDSVDDDDYADLPDLIPCNYVDDDITDVTEQYLAEREANKVVVDLTSDTNEND
jgi:hypothetical protein